MSSVSSGEKKEIEFENIALHLGFEDGIKKRQNPDYVYDYWFGFEVKSYDNYSLTKGQVRAIFNYDMFMVVGGDGEGVDILDVFCDGDLVCDKSLPMVGSNLSFRYMAGTFTPWISMGYKKEDVWSDDMYDKVGGRYETFIEALCVLYHPSGKGVIP